MLWLLYVEKGIKSINAIGESLFLFQYKIKINILQYKQDRLIDEEKKWWKQFKKLKSNDIIFIKSLFVENHKQIPQNIKFIIWTFINLKASDTKIIKKSIKINFCFVS